MFLLCISRRRKEDQLVFSRAPKGKFSASSDSSTIVPDMQPIIHIANTSRYTKKLLESDGIPFSLKRVPGTEFAVISETKNEVFVKGSKIIFINGLPTTAMNFSEIKETLSGAKWPITLQLERPADPALLVFNISPLITVNCYSKLLVLNLLFTHYSLSLKSFTILPHH